MKRRQFPRKPSTARTTKHGLKTLMLMVALAAFAPRPTFQGLQPKRYHGAKFTTNFKRPYTHARY